MAAIAAGKAAGAASRVLGRGGGTAIAGVVALRVAPGLVGELASQAGAGTIAVTGTNGKTTTALMLRRIAEEAGLRPLHNRSGSNMMRGVAAMLVDEASVSGSIAEASRRMAILEVDEATLPEVAREARPRAIVFTNLFRDQLDRYGEVDSVARGWGEALRAENQEPRTKNQGSGPEDFAPGGDLTPLPPLHVVGRGSARTTIVLNADDPAVAHLGRGYAGEVIYFGVEDLGIAADAVEHASDFRTCLACGGELVYSATFYGHVGHWRCPSCGNSRPAADVRLTREVEGEDATALRMETGDGVLEVRLPLVGLYNAYNALAATAGALAMGLPGTAIVSALEGFSAAFGRQERFSIDGRDVRVLLGKNPTGLNQVLRTIAAAPGEKRIVFFLNDGIADGRDVSWIWDADYELARPETSWVLAAGSRAEDLALRLKYAGFGDEVAVEHDAAGAARRGLEATPSGGTLWVVPTFTALVVVGEVFGRRGGVGRYWDS
jgi:UDP-N-acetylmuramyl tripeptide synthase